MLETKIHATEDVLEGKGMHVRLTTGLVQRIVKEQIQSQEKLKEKIKENEEEGQSKSPSGPELKQEET